MKSGRAGMIGLARQMRALRWRRGMTGGRRILSRCLSVLQEESSMRWRGSIKVCLIVILIASRLIDVAAGSSEEVEDIKSAYAETGGSIGEIMTYIPHSTHDDEARFIVLITDLISKGELVSLPAWESSVNDEKSRLVRKKQGEKEAKEAEKLAKE